MSTIAAIVPTYNRKDYLVATLQSLFGQTRPVEQIIVWDDGSVDGTEDAVKPLVRDNLTYHRAPNAGKSSALNQAMKFVKGDYVWICDDDDLLLPHAADTLAGILDSDPSIGVAGGSYARFSEGPSGRVVTDAGYWPDLAQGTPARSLLEDIFLFQPAMMVRRECYEKVGPFNENLHRSIDYDMIARLVVSTPIRMTEDILFQQRKHDGDRGSSKHRHAASDSEKVWSAQDRKVFQNLREKIPLSFYVAMYCDDRPELAERAGLMQRGCVYGRRNDWNNALDDFEAAASIATDVPLGATEMTICRRAMSGKHGVWPAPEEIQRLGELKERSDIGRQISQALGRGLTWRIRVAAIEAQPGEVIRLIGLLKKTGLSLKPDPEGSKVQERRELPAEAYLC